MTVNAELRQTITGALAAVQEVVERATELDSTERHQVLELVTDAKAEVQKDNPNGLKLRTMLTGGGTAIQTVASAPAAYALIKGAGALIGVHLP